MTFDDFIKKYDGQGIDFDGSYGFQCVDLYRQYCKESLGFPQSPPVEGAKDIWNTYLKDKFTATENTPTGIPTKGDIIIWGTGLGKYGHVSVFIDGTASKFNSFDQNYPTGSKCHIQSHTYKGVLGWLTPVIPKPIDDDLTRAILLLNGFKQSEGHGNLEGAMTALLGAFTMSKTLKTDMDSMKAELDDRNSYIKGQVTAIQELRDQQSKIAEKLKVENDFVVIKQEIEKLVQVETDLDNTRKLYEGCQKKLVTAGIPEKTLWQKLKDYLF